MSTELAIVEERGQSLAELMGITISESSGPRINRLHIVHGGIMGEMEFKGKTIKTEVIPAGAYRMTMGDNKVYANSVKVRIFAVRQQWQRWNSVTQHMEKSVMATDTRGDMMDNIGTFNLGRPSGYIADFQALPKETQELVRSVKRVKIIMGLATLVDPVDENGQPLDVADYVDLPFIYEVKNSDSMKAIDTAMKQITQRKMLPIMCNIVLTGNVGNLPTGATFATSVASVGEKVELTDSDNDTLRNFLEFVGYVNGKIVDAYHAAHNESLSAEDAAMVHDFIDIKAEEE